MAPRVGFEPTTYRLTAGCSTVELSRNIAQLHYYYIRLLVKVNKKQQVKLEILGRTSCFNSCYLLTLIYNKWFGSIIQDNLLIFCYGLDDAICAKLWLQFGEFVPG